MYSNDGIGKTLKPFPQPVPKLSEVIGLKEPLLLSDISSKDCYIIDVFRTEEGSAVTGSVRLHNKYSNGHLHKEQWHVTWEIDDSYYQMHHGDLPVYLEYTDVSGPSTVILCESWVDLWRDKKTAKKPTEWEIGYLC